MKKKFLSILIMTLLITALAVAPVFATGVMSQMTGDGDTGNIGEIGNNIFTIVQAVAVVVAIIMLVVLGIRYVSAPVGEKAEVKKQIVPYVVGVLFIFSAVGIIQLISGLKLI